MKRISARITNLAFLSIAGSVAAVELNGDYHFITDNNAGITFEQPYFHHELGEIQVGERGGEITAAYTGTRPENKTIIDIDKVSGCGDLALNGSSSNTLKLFRTAEHALDAFEGRLTICNYSIAWDDAGMNNTAAVLELKSTSMSGSIALDAAYCDPGGYIITALGINGDVSIGGLSAPDYQASASWLYSGSLNPATTKLPHTQPFSSHITAEPHTLTIDTAGYHQFYGNTIGTFNIVKKGSGTQVFHADLSTGNSYEVQAGTLALMSHTNAAAICLKGGHLSISGNLHSTRGEFSGHSTLTARNISGTSWQFHLDSGHQEAPLLTISGNTTLDSLHIIYNKSELMRGWYQLVQHNGSFTAAQVEVNGAPAQLESQNGQLMYYVADGERTLPREQQATLHWQAPTGIWQENSGHLEQIWQGCDTNNNFRAGDSAVFSQPARVTLAGELHPAQIWVNHATGRLEFEGSGSLAGQVNLNQTGNGTLCIATANTHSGSTIISNGTLETAHAQALGHSAVVLRGGCLDMQQQRISNTVQLQGDARLRGAQDFTGKLELLSGSLCADSLGQAQITCCGTATLQAEGTLTLASTIMNEGKLTLLGSFDLSALSTSQNPRLVDTTGAESLTGGFIRDAGCEVQLTTGGTLDTSYATLLLHGQEVKLNAAGYGSLPGALRPDTYYIYASHSCSVAAIRAMAGENLKRIEMHGGKLLVNANTMHLHASDGQVILENCHLGGALSGSTTLETRGEATLHNSHTYTGGTTITSGRLRINAAQALGTGPVHLGSTSRSNSIPTLDMGNHALGNPLHLHGSSCLSGLAAFTGPIFISPGAETTIAPGSVLQLNPGQTLTLATTGNTIHGQVALNGGSIIFTGGALTLHGSCAFTARTTLDLRAWKNLGIGQQILVLDYPSACNTELLTLLLPEHLLQTQAIFNPLTGELQLAPAPAAGPDMAAQLSPNQRAAYLALLRITNPEGKLRELAEAARTTTDLATLQLLLNRSSGTGYALLVPSIIESNLAHLHQLASLMGNGQRLSPACNTSVGLHAFHRTSSFHHKTQWGGQLVVEQHLLPDFSLGLALAAAQADITPPGEATLSESSSHLDLLAAASVDNWHFQASLGMSTHEFKLTRHRWLAPDATTAPAGSQSINLMGEIACNITPKLQPFISLGFSTTRLDDIHETDDAASLHVEEQSAHMTELGLGTRLCTRLAEHALLELEAAALLNLGDTQHELQTSFAGAPGCTFATQADPYPRWNYHLSAALSLPLSPQMSLRASAALQRRALRSQAGILLHF